MKEVKMEKTVLNSSEGFWWLVCNTCKIRHPVEGNVDKLLREFSEFTERHKGHLRNIVPSVNAKSPLGELLLGYAPNATVARSLGAHTSLFVSNLNSLPSSLISGWQSDRVDDTATLALDYEVEVKVSVSGTPASDKAAYVYLSPGYYNGASWYMADGGTGTLPGGSEGKYSLTSGSPSDLRLLGVLNYPVQNMIMQQTFFVSNAVGITMPDGWQIIIINYTGATILATGNAVYYKSVKQTVV
jgi:hypothetical protein